MVSGLSLVSAEHDSAAQVLDDMAGRHAQGRGNVMRSLPVLAAAFVAAAAVGLGTTAASASADGGRASREPVERGLGDFGT